MTESFIYLTQHNFSAITNANSNYNHFLYEIKKCILLLK